MGVTNYYWDELTDNLLMETDENDEVIATYHHEPTLHGELNSMTRDGKTYYYHYDGEGNTVAVTDEDENVVEEAEYTAFGEVVEKTSSIVNPFGYKGALGYYTNAETSDIYVRARMYEPVTGRWLSPDPLGTIIDENVYRYVFGNPINGSDPSGLMDEATVKRCENHWEAVLRNNKTIGKCYQDAIKKRPGLTEEQAKKCAELQFKCICCENETSVAFYRKTEHTVYMCAQNDLFAPGGDEETAARRICHELIHSLQYGPCNPNPWEQNCLNVLVGEIIADYCTYRCRTVQGCLPFAISSIKSSGVCKEGELTKELIKQAVDYAEQHIGIGDLCGDINLRPRGVGFRGANDSLPLASAAGEGKCCHS